MKNLTVQDWLQTNDQACVDIVNEKYLLEENILGHKETINEMLDRVSGGNESARILMEKGKFLPGGRIIANRGLWRYGIKVTYSNCYVDRAPEDSIESIYETCKRLARTFSYGGGVGIDISNLAPEGAKVRNTARKSTGAVSFVNTFSEVSETIGMHGRRAALMISIDGKHPDLEKFITHKSDLNITQGANMSVRLTDDFFKAVDKDELWKLEFTRKETGECIEKHVKARYIMSLIAETSWDYAEPGILYWDRICNYNLMSKVDNFQYAGTNPCGEEPLPAGGSCLLGAMNLSAYWNSNINRFEYKQFGIDVRTAVRFLNEVLEEGQQLHPLKEQRDTVYMWKQIGLGFMGLADLFIKAKMTYGSNDSLNLIHHIGYIMISNAIRESIDLAKEYGCFYECNSQAIMDSEFWEHNVIENPYLSDQEIEDIQTDMRAYGIRNSQLLTCAPTGTISTIFNISGGIEPIFALQFTRTVKSIYDKDKTYVVYPAAIMNYLKNNNLSSLDELKKLPEFMVTSRDIPWKERINVQAAWQEHIDASISATINLPKKTTVDDIIELYRYAHKAGLKGITIFREDCKRYPILSDTSNKEKEEYNEDAHGKIKREKINNNSNSKLDDDYNTSRIENISIINGKNSNCIEDVKKSFLSSFTPILTRSNFGENLHGTTYYKKVACGHIYITVNRFAGRPVEVFMQSSKSGGCAANTEALGRLASTMLRAGIDPNIVIDSTLGVKCAACSTMKGKGEKVSGLSCSDVMARVIRNEWNKYLDGEYDNEIKEYMHIVVGDETIFTSSECLSRTQKSDEGDYYTIIEDIKKQSSITECTDSSIWNYKDHSIQENIDHSICPECGAKLRLSEGCMKCDNCGFSKC